MKHRGDDVHDVGPLSGQQVKRRGDDADDVDPQPQLQLKRRGDDAHDVDPLPRDCPRQVKHTGDDADDVGRLPADWTLSRGSPGAMMLMMLAFCLGIGPPPGDAQGR